MLKSDEFCWKILTILVIALAIAFGSSLFKFLGPQWATTYLTDRRTDKPLNLHKLC